MVRSTKAKPEPGPSNRLNSKTMRPVHEPCSRSTKVLKKSSKSQPSEKVGWTELEKVGNNEIAWDAVPLDCTDPLWAAALKICPECSKVHPSGANASTCITKHGRLRCYLCLNVFENSEHLYDHFNQVHRGLTNHKNILSCPFCSDSVPFKSVTCHVISQHLPTVKNWTMDSGSTSPESEKEAIPQPGAPDCKSEEFRKGLRTCQDCKKEHPNASMAATCITSHGKLRCYLCLSIHKRTEQLTRHFEKIHRVRTDKPGTLTCPFCNTNLLFKSVSCHVISKHAR